MGKYHDQNRETVECRNFSVPHDMITNIILSITKARKNKSPWADGVHNKMLKLEPNLTVELLLELCNFIGQTSYYPGGGRLVF